VVRCFSHLAVADICREKDREKGSLGRALWSFMPLVIALSLTALVGLFLDTMSGNPNVTIFAVPVFMALSLIFEVRINGRENLRELLPFFLSCIIMGALMEISGVQKGYWSYSGIVSLANVILFGYVLFFYFAIKMSCAIKTLVKNGRPDVMALRINSIPVSICFD